MVAHYGADPIAEGSNDEKRIKVAEKQALGGKVYCSQKTHGFRSVFYVYSHHAFTTRYFNARKIPLDPFSPIHSRATNTAQVFQLAPLIHSGDLT